MPLSPSPSSSSPQSPLPSPPSPPPSPSHTTSSHRGRTTRLLLFLTGTESRDNQFFSQGPNDAITTSPPRRQQDEGHYSTKAVVANSHDLLPEVGHDGPPQQSTIPRTIHPQSIHHPRWAAMVNPNHHPSVRHVVKAHRATLRVAKLDHNEVLSAVHIIDSKTVDTRIASLRWRQIPPMCTILEPWRPIP